MSEQTTAMAMATYTTNTQTYFSTVVVNDISPLLPVCSPNDPIVTVEWLAVPHHAHETGLWREVAGPALEADECRECLVLGDLRVYPEALISMIATFAVRA